MCRFSIDKDMDHYILKVYRRDSDDPRKIAGHIQHVSTGCERPFSHIEELNKIISTGGSILSPEEKKKIRKRGKKKEAS